MTTNDMLGSQINNRSALNHEMVDILLYPESKITRKQAIREIADVILRSNIKPRTVECTLELLRKLLPSDNTLPSTTDELFRAMISSESDWRLTQYLIRHKQSPSSLSSSSTSSNTVDENINFSTTTARSSTTVQPESNSPEQPLSRFLSCNNDDSSSNSDDENELSAYERLQRYLRPITETAEAFNQNYVDALSFTSNNNSPSSIPNPKIPCNSVNPSTFLQSFRRLISETSSTASTNDEDLCHTRRLFAAFEDDTDDENVDANNKLCCFEMNGYDLLNGGKQRRYV